MLLFDYAPPCSGVQTSSRPRSSLHTVAYGFHRWIPRHGACHGLPRRHQPMMARLCSSSPCHESRRLTRSSWFTCSRTTPSNLIVRRTSCPIWGSKAATHNSDLQLQMKGTTTHYAAPLEDGLHSSKVGVQELQEKNPEENPHPAMCFSSLELVMLIFSGIL